MKCDLCAGDTAPRRVRRQHWLKGRLYTVENVEAEVCQECRERYFHARTLDRIDGLIHGDHEAKPLLSVEVLSTLATRRRVMADINVRHSPPAVRPAS